MKRRLAAVTIFFMVVSSTSIFAQEAGPENGSISSIPSGLQGPASIITQDKEVSPEKLTEILSKIKQKFVIYDEDAVFKYSIDFEYGINMYNLSWDSENYNTYIKYGEDENIYWYYSYAKEKSRPEINPKIKSLPAYDKKQASAIAEDFIQKSLPKEYNNFKFKANTGTLNSNVYNFELEYYKNEIQVDPISATIVVDAVTGKIINFSTSLNNSIEYEDQNGVLSLAQAKEAYKSQLGVKAIYQSEYNYKDNTIDNVKLVYVPVYGREYVIDAKTGKRINQYGNEMGASTSKEMTSSDQGQPALTEQEISEIQSKSDLASLNQVKAKIATYGIEILKSDMTVNSAQLYESKLNTSSGYIWSVNYIGSGNQTSANIRVDAKTMELVGFNLNNNEYSENQITKAQLEKAKLMAEKSLSRYSKLSKSKLSLDTVNLSEQENSKSPYVYIRYIRVENTVEFPENYVDMTYNVANNTVISFNQNWYNLKFPDPKNIVSKDTIYNQVFKENQIMLKYKINYLSNSAIKSNLIYEVNQDDYSKPIIFDALTGKRIVSDQPEKAAPSEYKDLDKSKYQKEIQTLLTLGIGFSGGELNPKKTINQDEYLYLIAQTFEYMPVPLYKMETMTQLQKNNIEEQLRARGVLLDDEKLLSQEITGEEAVKYLVRALGYEKIAVNSQIFKLDINDKDKVSDKYTGYVAIGDVLGIIIKDDNNNFDPQRKTTREEALKMVYNYLK